MNTRKSVLLTSALIYLLSHMPTLGYGVLDLAKKSAHSEMASILTFESLKNWHVASSLLQFLVIVVISSLAFIFFTARFAYVLERFSFARTHITSAKYRILIGILIPNVLLFLINAIYFDHSSHFGQHLNLWSEHHLFTKTAITVLIITLTIGWFTAINNWFWGTFTVLMCLLFVSFHSNQASNVERANNTKPNIILVGIDSLRSDLMWSHMPFLSNKLQTAEIFPLAYTELGRTFPAWNTILTGQYPVSHGARINLSPRDSIADKQEFLPALLQNNGYNTIFAYDETRFANFDSSFGFDKVISPKMGASDFIIGQIYDVPVTNILSLFKISHWLLPELYANRAAHKIYRPSSFNDLIDHQLPYANKPTLLATHFCLAHWPYKYSNSMYHPDFRYIEPHYPANLQAVDDQIKRLFTTLKNKGYLDNAIIVFLSDHGEAWNGEAPTFNSFEERRSFKRSASGHGSDLVTETANRVLVAFKAEEQLMPNENINRLASLADIAPTIADLLNVELSKANGISLKSKELPKDRWIPIETGTVFDLNEVDQANILETVTPFLDRYEINNAGLVQIMHSKLDEALQHKRYGVRNSRFVLTLEKDGFYLFNTIDNTFTSHSSLQGVNSKEAISAWCKWFNTAHCSE